MDNKFSVSGITFAVKEDPTLATARPTGWAEVVVYPSNPANKFAKHPAGAFELRWGAQKIGFVPDAQRDIQDKMLAMLEKGYKPCIEIVEYGYMDENEKFNNDHRGKLHQITCVFHEWEEAKAGLGESKPLTSFNEDVVVDFYEEPHVYMYEGKELTSATTLVKKAYKPFDGAFIAGKCAKSWGMDAADIVALWDLNGDAASAFGTSIHAYMEAYSKYGDRGLSKMSFIRDIVTSCPFHTPEVAGVEALITDVKLGLCGMADRLEKNAERVRVTDFKVQYGITDKASHLKNSLFPDLPANKLSKARIQLSIYAEMLQRNGVEVDDAVTVYAYDGAWERYDLPRVVGVLDKLS